VVCAEAMGEFMTVGHARGINSMGNSYVDLLRTHAGTDRCTGSDTGDRFPAIRSGCRSWLRFAEASQKPDGAEIVQLLEASFI
jgi:hypothetical protein